METWHRAGKRHPELDLRPVGGLFQRLLCRDAVIRCVVFAGWSAVQILSGLLLQLIQLYLRGQHPVRFFHSQVLCQRELRRLADVAA